MKILYLHQYFATPMSSGGTRSYEFALRLIKQGHEVHFITSTGYLPKQYKDLTQVCEIEFDGIPVTVIPVAYSNQMSFRRRIWAFIQFAFRSTREAMRHKPDLVFATSTPLTIAIPGILASRRRRVPMVFEVRDLWPQLPIAIGAIRNPLVKIAARALEWIAYHSAAHVVALSPGMAAGVIRRGIDPSKVTVIPNSCDVALFGGPDANGQPIRDRLGLCADEPLIVYTGTFGAVNGVCYLVELAAAARQIDPQMHFLIVGGGAEEQLVRDRARELGVLDQNVTIWESLPKVELPNITSAATIIISMFVPIEAMWHNSANKFFDGLASGRPIAIYYGGWQAEILRETGAGLVLNPDSPQEAAKQLVAYANDTDKVAKAGMIARELAEHRFNRDLLAEKLEEVFLSVAGTKFSK